MNELKIFKNSEFGEIRTVEIGGEPWFVGKDVAEVLGYVDLAHAVLDHVDEEDRMNSKTQGQIDLELGQRGGWLINESGLYSLILSSKLSTAKAFKRWVTSEVLPSIRKQGLYAKEELLDNHDIAIAAFKALKEEREARKALEAENKQMQPLVLFARSVSASDTSILIGDLAKLLKQNGYDTGQKKLFEELRLRGFLMKSGSSKNLPTQKAMELGLFEVKESTINNPDGSVRVTKTTKVTGKGQVYFVNLFLGKQLEEKVG
ncbi:phage antirepressor KilAC domain-containing protein [Lachnoanaerobaculum sp. Marseille-Q4761]|nr:phage antirepressor KilAC domain-containing protein [Lachnoanaerobaculum sp. Marseille-Q4761]MBO1870111.1 phage antirepressor KilAC domain-containing protein [Lachnoanaerobaculum sp. Marseille-Q4761]